MGYSEDDRKDFAPGRYYGQLQPLTPESFTYTKTSQNPCIKLQFQVVSQDFAKSVEKPDWRDLPAEMKRWPRTVTLVLVGKPLPYSQRKLEQLGWNGKFNSEDIAFSELGTALWAKESPAHDEHGSMTFWDIELPKGKGSTSDEPVRLMDKATMLRIGTQLARGGGFRGQDAAPTPEIPPEPTVGFDKPAAAPPAEKPEGPEAPPPSPDTSDAPAPPPPETKEDDEIPF